MEHKVSLVGEYLLLVLDDRKGAFRQDMTTIDYTIAAAELVHLVSIGALAFADDDTERGRRPSGLSGCIFVAGDTVPDDPLEARLAEVAAGHSYQEAVTSFSNVAIGDDEPRSLRKVELEKLVDAGVVASKHTRFLGIIPRTRHPEIDPSVEVELRERLTEVLKGNETPDDRSRALIALLYAGRGITKVFPDLDRKRVQRRAEEIAGQAWEDDGLAEALAQYASYMATLSAASFAR